MAPRNATERRLMSPKQVADWLGLPVATLYQWRHRNYGPPAAKVGKHLRYDPDQVTRWLEQQTDSKPA